MKPRVLSGMRPTGALHLGHYHGALKNWVRLQQDYDCFYFVADWHALTTHYEDREVIERNVYDMVIDWVAAGLDPERCTIFLQSRMPEHAELFTLLAMGTPLGWLERVPTYKDQMEKLKDRDLATYGFLGYPLLQAADILIYKAAYVPVGEDQASHVELTREVARRFNHLYGRAADFEAKVAAALAKLGKDDARYYEKQRRDYGQSGKTEALAKGEAIVAKAQANVAGWTSEDGELLLGHLKGAGKTVLPEPAVLLTEVPKLPGLDGGKMSKSYGNTIAMREEPAEVERKIKRMATDPKRVRRTDPGTPEDCPVWQFHLVYSDEATKTWAHEGCKTAGIGCLDCKQPVIDAVLKEQQPWRERAEALLTNPKQVHWIVEVGTERARTVAKQTMKEVRDAMGLSY
ncbi:MAG TPA: tryptophan--tRNA ligase [Burkholderiaceae bacterium]|nr:tryptophan--tRNA ligase [Burkholderiaceae bacterium]